LTSLESFAEVQWLQPYPDQLLDEIGSALFAAFGLPPTL
jgi:hypothetical protein